MPVSRETLTKKQQAFVREYPLDWNATQAAIRAGYSSRTARSVGSENLTKPAITAALAESQKTQVERLQRTADDIALFHWSVIDDPNLPISERLKASSQEMRRFAEYKDGVTINNDNRTLVIGEGRLGNEGS